MVKRTVYVLVDGKPAPREVTTGITDGRVTEITGGELKEGETCHRVDRRPESERNVARASARGFRIL